jgi:hypothetical protein
LSNRYRITAANTAFVKAWLDKPYLCSSNSYHPLLLAATVYPQVILVLHKHNKMELIAHRPNYAGLFKDKRLEKGGL